MGLSPDWSYTTRCSAPANSSVWLSRQTPERFPPGEGAEQSVEGLGDKGLGGWHRPTKVPGACEKIHQATEGSAEVRGWSGRTGSCCSAVQVKVGGRPRERAAQTPGIREGSVPSCTWATPGNGR